MGSTYKLWYERLRMAGWNMSERYGVIMCNCRRTSKNGVVMDKDCPECVGTGMPPIPFEELFDDTDDRML